MTESLESLSSFVRENPQVESQRLQYAFLGGTAIRLIQESMGAKEKRIISDFDIVRFEKKTYSVHALDPEIVFGLVHLDKEGLIGHVSDTEIEGREYYFLDGSFLTLTKTCALDSPREKDYKDVSFLYENGAIDLDKLRKLYEKTNILPNNPELALNTLEWMLDRDKDIDDKIRLFQTFPKLVNLLDKFDDSESARKVIMGHVQSNVSKGGYELSSVLYGINSVISKIDDISEEEKREKLSYLLRESEKSNHIDFNKYIQNK